MTQNSGHGTDNDTEHESVPDGGSASDAETVPGRVSGADPTLVRNQPALTTSTGLEWLIVGGLLAATGIAVLASLVGLGPAGVAAAGIVTIVVLYAAMVVVRVTMKSTRTRLAILAALLLALAIVGLVAVGVITSSEWSALG